MVRQDQRIEKVPRTGGSETKVGVSVGTVQLGCKVFILIDTV